MSLCVYAKTSFCLFLFLCPFTVFFPVSATEGPFATPSNQTQDHDLTTLTESQQAIIIRVRVAISFLSIFGSLFTILSFFLFGRYKLMSSHLVLALTIVSLLEGIANVLSLVVYDHEESNLAACYAQGILLQFSQSGIFAWTTVIALNLYLVVCKNWPTNNLEGIYHGVVWLWTCLVTFVPIAGQAYGIAGVWCWFTRTNGQIYRWIFFYIPLFLQIIIVIVFYALIVNSIRKRRSVVQGSPSEDSEIRAHRLLIRLRIYPLITFVLYLFPIINRIYDATSTFDSFFLYLMQSLTAPSMGFVIAIVYGLDDEMRQLWKDFVKDHFCKKSASADVDYVSSSSEDIVEFSQSESEQGHAS